MKKRIAFVYFLILTVVMSALLAGCGSSDQGSEAEKLTGKDFIANLSEGLEKRWELVDSNVDQTSLSAQQDAFEEALNAEIQAIGDINNYEFEDENLKSVADQYMKGLDLQKKGLKYVGTDRYNETAETWQLGYYYRAVCLEKLAKDYGLTVSNDCQKDLDDMIADSVTGKEEIAIHEFVNDLSKSIKYAKDEKNSNEYLQIYTAVIENTTEYEIDSLEISLDFLDDEGVVVYQTFDYLENIKPGGKVRSSVDYDMEAGNFKSIEVKVTAYQD